MYESIFENLPGNPRWVGSFYERLVEDAVWDKAEFWKLHLALTEAGSASGSLKSINRELAWAVAKIQSRVLGVLAAHYNPNDIFVISNLAPDELCQFIERFDHAVLGVFSGEVPAESSYDLINPLIGVA
ncbi:hypothetical protein [Comamonas sp.]|uniref:hypothetical protein n=1 Tax=Comamonas sp. TaxID=34028 RepID=UPI003A90DE15